MGSEMCIRDRFRGNGGMQIGQRVGIIEPRHFRNKTFDQVQHSVGTVDKPFQQLTRIYAGAVTAFVKPAFHARGFLRGRKPHEGEIIAALVEQPGFLKLFTALDIEERGSAVGKQACRIFGCRIALRFHEDRPAGTETTQRTVESYRSADQFGGCGAVEIGTTETGGPLE